MRSRIKINGKYYRPVPWIEESGCEGCAFEKADGCPHQETDCCDYDAEFGGKIFIAMGKEAMAEYIAKRLQPKDDA